MAPLMELLPGREHNLHRVPLSELLSSIQWARSRSLSFLYYYYIIIIIVPCFSRLILRLLFQRDFLERGGRDGKGTREAPTNVHHTMSPVWMLAAEFTQLRATRQARNKNPGL